MQSTTFQAKVWQKLIKFDKDNKFLKPKIKVLVALSGGADSVSLLHFIKQLSLKRQFSVFACHINHNLRKSAKRDEELSKEICKVLDVPFVAKKVAVKPFSKKENLSVEHAARKLRYAALVAGAKKFGCQKIALAHHADDNAETFILNIIRGTKAKGLAGIPPKRTLGKVEIIRPFLCLSKKEILEYVKIHKLPFAEDETNFDDTFTRNWIRLKLLPMLENKQPQIRQHILNICKELQKNLQHFK